MPGVVKTCTLRAICHDLDIRTRCRDGIYVIGLGQTPHDILLLTAFVKVSRRQEVINCAGYIGRSICVESAIEIAMKMYILNA